MGLDGKCENRSESPITSSFFEAIWAFLLRFSHRVPNSNGIGAQGIDCQFSRADVRASHRSIIRRLRTILRDVQIIPGHFKGVIVPEGLHYGFVKGHNILRSCRQ